MEVDLSNAPCVEHGLRMGLTVDVDQHRVFLRGVEVLGLEHPGVHCHAAVDGELEELRWPGDEVLHPLTDGAVVLEHAHNPMRGDFDQFDDRWRIQGGIGVEGPCGIGRENVVVRAGLIRRGDPLQRPGTGERHAVEVFLRGVVRRGVEVVPAAGFVDHSTVDEVVIAWREHGQPLAVARPAVRVPPSISFIDHHELPATTNPGQSGVLSLARIRPGIVFLVEDPLRLVACIFRGGLGEEKVAAVAETTELLDQHLVGVARPFDLAEVKALLWRRDR